MWPGSAALALWLREHPEAAAGRRVLDLGCGCGLGAIAAAKAGAAHVRANDVDPFALAATERNAALNGVALELVLGDLTADEADEDELILVGDLCYEGPLASRLVPWLRRRARSARVVFAEPGRRYAPREGLLRLEARTLPVSRDLERDDTVEVVLSEVLADG